MSVPKAKGMGYWAATQVKGFSPEIHVVPEADIVPSTEDCNLIADSPMWAWRGDASPTGSCLWFEKEVKKRLNGFAQLVRYADDFVVCFQHGDEARAFGKALGERIAKFGLTISEEKSRIIYITRIIECGGEYESQKVYENYT